MKMSNTIKCPQCDIEINTSKSTLFISKEKLNKIMISLAYQKERGKLIRKDINHLDVLKRLREQ